MIVQLFWHPHARVNVNSPFEIVEVDLVDFGQVSRALEAKEVIRGEILITVGSATQGVRTVTRRIPIAFRGTAVERAQLPTWTFVDRPEGSA